MIALFNILVNHKRGISIKEKQTAQLGNVRESYSRQNIQIHAPKKKNFLYSNEGTIDYNQQYHPLHLRKIVQEIPSKKKKVRTRKGRRRKRRRKEERMRKRGRESGKKKEKEKKEEKEKEEEKNGKKRY